MKNHVEYFLLDGTLAIKRRRNMKMPNPPKIYTDPYPKHIAHAVAKLRRLYKPVFNCSVLGGREDMWFVGKLVVPESGLLKMAAAIK